GLEFTSDGVDLKQQLSQTGQQAGKLLQFRTGTFNVDAEVDGLFIAHHLLRGNHQHITDFHFPACIAGKKDEEAGLGHDVAGMDEDAQPVVVHAAEQPDAQIGMLEIAEHQVVNSNQRSGNDQWQPIAIHGDKSENDKDPKVHLNQAVGLLNVQGNKQHGNRG